ncbi:MAG TPA: hypothetical protein VFE63_17160 [Roseiarcus sp.]|nr:hypothetical protein [Roseiarcus sp.]
MLADEADRARLRALYALFLDEADFRADRQPAEGPIKHRIAVKIDFSTVRRFDEAALVAPEKLRDAAMVFNRMLLDLTAQLALGLLDLAHRSVKGLPDRDPRVLALGGVAAPPVDDHVLIPRHGYAKPNLKQITVAMPGLRAVDNDMTTRDARTEFFEALRLRSDLGSDLFRWLALPEGDVDWRLHFVPHAPDELPATIRSLSLTVFQS